MARDGFRGLGGVDCDLTDIRLRNRPTGPLPIALQPKKRPEPTPAAPPPVEASVAEPPAPPPPVVEPTETKEESPTEPRRKYGLRWWSRNPDADDP